MAESGERGAPSGGDHLDDGRLLSIVTEGSADDHLGGCAQCQSRLDVIRRASAQFSEAVQSLSPSPLDPRLRRSLVRRARPRAASRWVAYPMVAAATILLLASAALAAPVRHWIVRALSGHEAPPVPGASSSPLSALTASHGTGAMTVSFAASDSVLAVQVATFQVAGVLEIIRSDGASISARITGGGADEEFLIAPGLLRIRNGVTSRAAYRVAVPSAVKTIRLKIGAAAERTIAIGPATHESIPLAAQRE